MQKHTTYKSISATLLLLGASMGAGAQTASDSIYKQVDLDSVVVTGKRPMVHTEGTKDVVNVKGTFLAKMGNLGNMLAMTPGIVTTGPNQFSVLGKGTPTYYVDGREVTQQDIFKTIKAGNIAKIEIEREPSAKYPAGTAAVINIITLRPLKDRISLDLYNTASIKRKASEDASVELKMNTGKWTSSLNYDYGTWGNLNKETYFTEIVHPEYTFRSDEANNNYSRSLTHSLSWANDYYFSNDHRLSFVYNYERDDSNENNGETTTYTDLRQSTTKDITRKNPTLRNQHTFSLSYSGKTGKDSRLWLSADFSTIGDKAKATSDETNKASLHHSFVSTRNYSTYNVTTLNASYSFLLPYKINTQVGARYYSTHHPLDYTTLNNNFVEPLHANNHQLMRDKVSAGYYTLTRSWKKTALQIGGRYEYSDTRMEITTRSDTYKAARHTSDFLPSAVFVWTPNSKWRLQANYSRSVSRQGYAGLNPYPTYQDSLAYASGNSALIPSYTTNYSLYAFCGGLTLGAYYQYTSSPISNVTYCPDLTTNVTCEMPINFKRSRSYTLVVGYRHGFGKLYFSGTAYLSLPHDHYTFLDETATANKPSWSGNFNLSYPFSSHFTAFTSFSYQSRNYTLNRRQKAADNWQAGVQGSFLNDRLSLSLTMSDILHDANYNNVYCRYVNTRQGTYGTNDIRGLTLSVSYSLFNSNLNVKASKNNDDIIQRTK